MKKYLCHFGAMAAVAVTSAVFTGCSSDDDFLSPYEESAIQTRATNSTNAIINFDNAPADVMASDQYGANLYSATAGGKQVTTGYLTQIGESGTYIQFPINYLKQEWVTGQPWEYEFWNGGFAISNFHNMTQGDYQNQCSVYDEKGGINGSNFAVAFGYSDSYNDPNKTYSKCAKIYLTNETGYRVVEEDEPVEGEAKKGIFNSVYVCNTTYTYLVMKNGNSFTTDGKSLEEQNGWFKVVFIGFDDANKQTGSVDYYLANYASNQNTDLENAIRMGWNKVDLTNLGTEVSKVVINFEGSDTGDYGLNTPTYVAIDNLDVTVN